MPDILLPNNKFIKVALKVTPISKAFRAYFIKGREKIRARPLYRHLKEEDPLMYEYTIRKATAPLERIWRRDVVNISRRLKVKPSISARIANIMYTPKYLKESFRLSAGMFEEGLSRKKVRRSLGYD